MSNHPPPHPLPIFHITSARTPSTISQAHILFTAYAATPGIVTSLSAQKFQHELDTLPAYYTPPGGELLLAVDEDGSAVGCVAVRPLPRDGDAEVAVVEKGLVGGVTEQGDVEHDGTSKGDYINGNTSTSTSTSTSLTPPPSSTSSSPKICEVKRLYVLPTHRSHGVGRLLIAAILPLARDLGYTEARLDTLPWMRAAVKLYEEFGFERIEAYHPRWGISNEELLFFGKRLV